MNMNGTWERRPMKRRNNSAYARKQESANAD
jgi:hypothetical protein